MSQVSQSAGVTPDLEEIAGHVFRVPLPLPLPDLKAVNAYIVTGPDGVTLIDPGWAYEPSEVALRSALAALGAAPPDVRRILATHQHWDHYSLAVRWRDQFGAELMLGREEQHSMAAFTRLAGVHPTQVGMLVRAGARQLADAVDRLEWEPHERDVAFSPPDRWLDDGDVIDCGATTIVVRATPGHTRGHMVFDDTAHAMVFTGDHLLPRITPSIAFERAPEALPLRSYMSSLRLFLDLPDSRMLPAHGVADRLTRGRAVELLDHHRERLDRVADLVAAGAVTAFEVARRMRWTRHERTLDELGTVHQMTAVLEVLAHLELLATQGILTTHDSDAGCAFSVS
jgi:glyoxylase-like metal-dependent hydrolase (beta-lactamase superfamily II)